MDQKPEKLTLEPLAGPDAQRYEFLDPERRVLGRSSGADIRLREDTVSRQHAAIEWHDDEWTIQDLGSKHGTYVNTAKLGEASVVLHDGDLLRVGPWTFHIKVGEASRRSTVRTTDDAGNTESRVQLVPATGLRSLAQHRLEVLIACSARINAAEDEEGLGRAVLSAALDGSGFARGAFVRAGDTSDEVEVVAFQGPGGESEAQLTLSRSLINAAKTGEVARLESEGAMNYGESIASLGIHSALCAPVRMDETVAAFVYLDARNAESSVRDDAAEFCRAVAEMSGMALTNIRGRALRERDAQLRRDLMAARKAQQLLLPKAVGGVAGVSYAMRMEPGRFVAGDLFDVVVLPGGRVAAFLGDVTGKGVGASLLMATTMTRLGLALVHYDNLGEAVEEVNRYLTRRTAEELFVSLWVGMFDPAERTLSFVDAGHGWWVIRREDGSAEAIESEGGLPLGVSADASYAAETITLGARDRVVVFSDGVIEQPGGDEGAQFGRQGVIDALSAISDSPEEDVNATYECVVGHAGETALSDDVTVASIGFASTGA